MNTPVEVERDIVAQAKAGYDLIKFHELFRTTTRLSLPAESATELFLDSQGNLWVTAPGAVYSLSPNERRFQMRETTRPWLIREAPDRTLWMSEYGVGIRAVNGPLAQFHDSSKPALSLEGGPHQVLLDRDGSMWFIENGIARIASPEKLAGARGYGRPLARRTPPSRPETVPH